MNKILKILGAIFLGLIIVISITFAMASSEISKLNDEANKFIKTKITQLTKDWDSKILYDITSPELKSQTNPEDFIKIFEIYSILGKLKEINSPKGKINIKLFAKPKSASAVGYFECQSEFEKGPAIIKITLAKHQDQWLVSSFHINSSVFLEKVNSLSKQ